MTRQERQFRADVRRLLIAIKRETCWPELTYVDEYGDKQAYLDVTIGADDQLDWSYQTGDNSYTGGAYGFPHWGVVQVWPRCNCSELADAALDQVLESISQSKVTA